ncbi:MAG: methylated-DNA--[protein]-cysteine S-methyltransferase [Clostridiales bacterium]|nr:methylated-DNA--[protein]-cysteine S-methyltransferase [Clostridiales bacterium]
MAQERGTEQKSVRYIGSPVGEIGIAEDGKGISDLFFSGEGKLPGAKEQDTALLDKAAAQLGEYFSGKRLRFDLPLSLTGTDFQTSVWKALLEIPYGKTCSYKDVAEKIGSPKAFRAVGMANHRNPVSIIVPCHRVIGQDGSLVGYGGGLPVKDFLLRLERRYVMYREMHIIEDEPGKATDIVDVDKEIW